MSQNGKAIGPKGLVDAAGQPLSATAEADMGDISSQMPEMQNPLNVLLARTKQQRASMIGALTGAYLTMTDLDPGDVEFVQSPKEDGSIGFRFRPKEPQDHLWVIKAQDCSTGEEKLVRIMSNGCTEEAAKAYAAQCEAAMYEHAKTQEGGERHDFSCEAIAVPLAGFAEDLPTFKEG